MNVEIEVEMLDIKKMELGPLDVNTYIVRKENSDECFVVDPADYVPVSEYINRNKLKLCAIMLTHGHFDHILGVAGLKEKYGAKIYIHRSDAQALSDSDMNMSKLADIIVKPSKADVLLSGGEMLNVAGIDIRVISTPGHTRGGVCYIIDDEKTVFTGDTLFRLSVGRTDLYGASENALISSLADVMKLDDDYRVLPGHMRESSIGFERERNPFIRHFC